MPIDNQISELWFHDVTKEANGSTVSFLTTVWGPAVPAKGGQTAGSPGALFSKQAGMICRVKERLKEGVQRILRPIRAGGAVACRGAVGRRGPAAGRCQWCHTKGNVHTCRARRHSHTGDTQGQSLRFEFCSSSEQTLTKQSKKRVTKSY